MITINYKVKALYTQDAGSLQDYVLRAIYEIEGTDSTYTAALIQSVNFQINADNEEFVPFAKLTEELVVGWIKESIGESGEKIATDTITIMIANKKNQPNSINCPPLPWN